ncbi:hypothetical protein ACA910_003075 [Epithemia clementina (nom. ined.)]
MDREVSDNPPMLAPSVSEDIDEPPEHEYKRGQFTSMLRPDGTTSMNFRPQTNEISNKDEDSFAFLLRYESMLQKQEAENIATLDHIQPCLERLEQLIHGLASAKFSSSNDKLGTIDSTTTDANPKGNSYFVWQHKVRFYDLQHVLEWLEQQAVTKECLATDRQLMLVLRTILARSNISTSLGCQSRKNSSNNNKESRALNDMIANDITWAELVQCYKTCVAGMQTLQLLPGPSLERDRTRNRTIAMISLFDMDSTTSMNHFSKSAAVLDRPLPDRLWARSDPPTTKQSIERSVSSKQDGVYQTNRDGHRKSPSNSVASVSSLFSLIAVVVLTTFCSLCVQEYFRDLTKSLAEVATLKQANITPEPEPVHVLQERPIPTIPQQQPATYKTPLASVPEFTRPMNPMTGRSAAAVSEQNLPVESIVLVQNSAASNDVVKELHFAPTVLGAAIVGPVAAFLTHAWQAGPMASAYSILPAIVFGAGIVSLASVALHSLRAFLAKLGNRIISKRDDNSK